MDNESKVTYSVVAVLVIFLAGIAYFLQPGTDIQPSNQGGNTQATTTNQPLTANTLSPTEKKPMEDKKVTTAVITTNKGVIEFEFGTGTPVTIDNFKKLATSHFYDGVRFHRVIKGFMIQVGDPLSKDTTKINEWGTGGPGYTIAEELTGREQYPTGTVAMARTSAPHSTGSQFFIVTAAPAAPLAPDYTVFGKVTKGLEVAMAIQDVQTGAANRPVEDVTVEKIELR